MEIGPLEAVVANDYCSRMERMGFGVKRGCQEAIL